MKDLMIDRQKAIKLAADYLYNLMSPRCIGLTPDHCWKEAEDMLAKVPSAEPERKWVLCSERLPENGRQVLVYAISTHFVLAKYDEMREADGSYIKQWVTFDAWKPFYRVKDVIAWMELPEPCRR